MSFPERPASLRTQTRSFSGAAVAWALGLTMALGQGSDPSGIRSLNTEATKPGPPPALEVAAKSVVPPGFHLSVVASEPQVHQPIAMATDSRGRLWVAENYSYSEQQVGFHPQVRDRILIFEDTDQDGTFDRRTVFLETAERLTSIEPGLGGLWAICLPHLVFIPDRNRDDVPDGPAQVLLDGFDYQAVRHNVANGLRWGPDGWLYGRHGILGKSMVGAPGTPESNRTPVHVGLWRYHPVRRVFEIVANGTTNPWGMDWDARGELFFINTVIGHLWHAIPGAHFRRMFGDDADPYVYELMEQQADHVHWARGEVWTDVRKQVSDATLAAGGGHAHSGLLIYQGGHWPAEWAGKVFMINFHGRKLNIDRLERRGSGYVGRHEPDPVAFADPWFRGIDLLAAPDGGVFISDWSDAGECHDHDGIHRTSGRIYKLSFGHGARMGVAPAARSELELAGLQRSSNDWLARQARRELADRSLRGEPLSGAKTALNQVLHSSTNEIERLRVYWALHLIGGLDHSRLRSMLKGSEHERVWALALWEDARHTDPVLQKEFLNWADAEAERMAAHEPSARVRLAFASLLQRLDAPRRLRVARGLLRHAEDAGDTQIPLMLWYGIKDLATRDPEFVGTILDGRIQKVQRLAARRLAEEIDRAPGLLESLLVRVASGESEARALSILDGMADGFAGRHRITKPRSWSAVESRFGTSASEPLRLRVRDLSALFGDGRALSEIRAVALNGAADYPRRRAALRSLIEAQAEGLRPVCEALLSTRDLSATAARGLALFEDEAIAIRMLEEWPKLYGHERPEFLNALLSRPSWAGRVLEAMAEGKFRKSDLTPVHAAQIRAFGQESLNRTLAEVWGIIQELDETARQQALQSWRKKLSPESLSSASAAAGEQVFMKACGSCHKLYELGASLGPDLTGSGRHNLDYLLENILFPSAIVPADYRQVTLSLKDGRSLTGAVRSRGARTLTLEMVGQTVSVDRADLVREEVSSLSVMPEGLLEQLNAAEISDLFAFLMSSSPPRRIPNP